MGKEVTIVIKGLNCIVPKNTIENLLICKEKKPLMEYNRFKRKMEYKGKIETDFPLYSVLNKDSITIGIGAIMFLKKHNPEIKFVVQDYFPKDRKTFDVKIKIPEGIFNAPKFKVEKFYQTDSYFYFGKSKENLNHSDSLDNLIKIEFEDGNILVCDEDQEIFINGEWQKMKDLLSNFKVNELT